MLGPENGVDLGLLEVRHEEEDAGVGVPETDEIGVIKEDVGGVGKSGAEPLAIFRSRPSPFCVLDEVDAALDEANIERFLAVLREFLAWTQFIVVTHSKKTMVGAETLYGITMQESGVSKRVAVRFEDVSDNGEFKRYEEIAESPSAADDQAA